MKQTTTKPQNKQFLEILSEAVESTGTRIFTFQSVCVGYFKSLDEYYQNIVLKLMCSKSTPLDTILVQLPDMDKKIDEVEKQLVNKFKVVQKVVGEDGKTHYKLERHFQESMKTFLSRGLNTVFQVNTSTIETCLKKAGMFEDKLKALAFSRWNNMHKFMLGSKSASFSANVNVVGALEDADLVMSNHKNNSTCFDFLLDQIKNQVSIFLYSYCKHLFKVKYKYLHKKEERSDKEAVGEGNILNLIFHLSLLFPLVSYSVKKSQETLADLQLTSEVLNDIMKDLDAVGLLKIKLDDAGNIKNFATTPLMNNIFNSNIVLERGFKNDIIVETDFKIYAYSNNLDYLEALLNLFTDIKFKMPTLIVCSLEEDKIRQAFSSGIEPQQILRYLNSNVHREVLRAKMQVMTDQDIQEADKTFAFLPENVVQQMMIWKY